MAEKQVVKLIKKEEVAKDTMVFTFSKPAGFTYRAGQTVDLIIPNLSGKNVHIFSLITEPSEENLAIATRMRDSDYKNALRALEPGSDLEIEGPYGSFMLHQDENKSAVFLVGGIGITPFMSFIKDAKQNKKPHKLYLFYSNREPSSTAFFDELQSYANDTDLNLTFVPALTESASLPSDWSYEQGYINWEMIKKYVPDSEEVIYYMAGPEAMVSAMRKLLNENGVSDDSIRFEEFSGY